MSADYIREALDLARQGRAQASPNPMVGAVLVRDGEVVGRGFHTFAGRKHAEIVALEEAGERARGATLYINLEPCSHTGRTGPCADALVAAGVTKVVAAMRDPNPLVAGDEVFVGVRLAVPDVQRAGDRRRRRVDGVDLVARLRPVEPERALLFPPRPPLGFKALE